MGKAKSRKFTILHSNDLHGDFFPKETDGKESGGLSRLAGYVEKTRKEEENVIYAIASFSVRDKYPSPMTALSR